MFKNNLELILGPVACGKTAELLRRVERYEIAGYKVLLVKPEIDTRSEEIKSRSGAHRACITLRESFDVFKNIENVDVIAFDEAQFFDDIFSTTKELVEVFKKKVLISALDSDFNGQPFKEIPNLIILADSINKLTAICMKCRCDFAIYSQKLRKGGEQIEVGDLELYEPRCNNCFVAGGLNE